MANSLYKKFNVPSTVSFDLIVRDEEADLARCLDSIVPIADEIVIVDTGSKDKTLEIAKEYTHKVYSFEWIDDYAAARNYADSKATCGWIFSIDADEILPDWEHYKIKWAIKQPQNLAYMVATINYTNRIYGTNRLAKGIFAEKYKFKWFNFSYKLRLFQNIPQLYWTGKIHEQVRESIMKIDPDCKHIVPVDVGPEITVHHIQHEEEDLLKKQLKYYNYGMEKLKTTRNFNTLYETGILCQNLKKHDQCIELLEEAWVKRDDKTRHDFIFNVRMALERSYKAKGLTFDTDLFDRLDEEAGRGREEMSFDEVSLIIVTYGNKIEDTEITIETAIEWLNYKDELIIIANEPSDDLKELISQYSQQSPYIYSVINDTNIGWTAACNQGAKLAKNNILIFGNYDLIFTYNWKEELIKYFRVDKKVGAVGPVSDNVNHHRLQYIEMPKGLDVDGIVEFSKKNADLNKGNYIETDLLIGFCIAVRKDAWELVGGMDNSLFGNSGGCDDDDLSMKLTKAGYHLLVANDVVIYHTWKRERNSTWAKIQKDNYNKLINKWYGEKKIKIEGVPDKILITNVSLKYYGGTERYVYDLAKVLKDNGSEVFVYSQHHGDVSERLKYLGVNIVPDIGGLRYVIQNHSLDIIHCHHRSCLKDILSVSQDLKVQNKILYVSHGVLEDIETPESNTYPYIDKLVGVSKEVRSNLQNLSNYKKEIPIIHNGIDIYKFKKIRRNFLNPRNLIVLNNHVRSSEGKIEKNVFEHFAEKLNLNLTIIGLGGKYTWDVHHILNEADVVIGVGRSVYEGLAMGKNVIVANPNRMDGIVSSKNIFKKYLNKNCSGRTNNKNITIETLENEMEKYNSNFDLSNYIQENMSLEIMVKKLVKLYNER